MTRPDLVEQARLELATREVTYPQQIAQGKRDAGNAGRAIAAWRAILELLRCGEASVEPCLGSSCPQAWPALVEAAHAAAEHRLRKALKDGSDESALRSCAAREIRDVLMRSAIRQGAKLPSFDRPGGRPTAKAA